MTEEQLRKLGLEGWVLGSPSNVPTLGDDVAEGLSLREVTVSALLLNPAALTEIDFAEAYVPAAESVQAQIERMRKNPHILRISFPSGTEVEMRSLGESEVAEVAGQDPEDPSRFYVDLRHSQPLAFVRSGEGLAFDPEKPDSLRAVFRPIQIPNLANIESPIAEWITESSDTWLSAAIIERLERGRTWEQLAATGMYARLLEPNDEGSVVTDLLEGKPDAYHKDLHRPRAWIQRLDADAVATIEALALAELDSLDAALEELEEPAELSEPGVNRDLVEVCHARDDLEGIRLLLALVERSETLDMGLEFIDRAGRDLMSRLDFDERWQDERLHRAHLADPDAWWADPVRRHRGRVSESGSD